MKSTRRVKKILLIFGIVSLVAREKSKGDFCIIQFLANLSTKLKRKSWTSLSPPFTMHTVSMQNRGSKFFNLFFSISLYLVYAVIWLNPICIQSSYKNVKKKSVAGKATLNIERVTDLLMVWCYYVVRWSLLESVMMALVVAGSVRRL